jgi:acetyltransferase-like isoleucine patch superfamily enzyme
LRNPAFQFDETLDSRALFQFIFIQMVCMIRALRLLFYFRNPKGALFESDVRFFNLSKIRWGKFLKLGRQVYVSGLAKEGVTFGNNVGIGAHSQIIVSTSLNDIGKFIHIGNHVGIGEFAYLGGAGGLEIGDDTIVGQYFSCHPENHNYQNSKLLIREQGVTRKGILIGKNCWIGSKVTVLDGVHIGDGCVIAAGAVVTQSFKDNSIIGGVPAKLIKSRNE